MSKQWSDWISFLEETRGEERDVFSRDWVPEHGHLISPLTWDVFRQMRLNSKEREMLLEYMDDDCLMKETEALLLVRLSATSRFARIRSSTRGVGRDRTNHASCEMEESDRRNK